MTPQEAIKSALREIEPDGKGVTVVNLENIKALLASALDELAERDKQIAAQKTLIEKLAKAATFRILALDDLLVMYRLGDPPKEKILNALNKSEVQWAAALAAAKEIDRK